MKSKKIVFGILILLLLIGLIGLTYAAYTYSRVGINNSKQIVGDIYMHYRESNVLTLSNAMPSSTYDSTKYFEFTIDGKNTYTKKDIYYEIDLTHGSDPNIEGRTIRLDDKFLKFRLVEVVNNSETEIFTNKSYNDLTNKRIHVETIPKNTTNEITKTYRIYMWIDNSLKIGNNNADYSLSDWNKIYASIKVNVSGDFTEKVVEKDPTDATCFTITVENEEATITKYDSNCGGSDVVIPEIINGYRVTTIGENAFSGFETVFQGSDKPLLTSVVIGNSVEIIKAGAFNYNNISSVVIGNNVTIIEPVAFSFNFLTEVVIPENVTYLSGFSSNQLTSILIPNSVMTIGDSAFEHNQLTSVSIPNSVTIIGGDAFDNNHLTSIVIPDSVTTIGEDAFRGNELTSVTIGNSVAIIGGYAFSQNQLTSVSIPDCVTTIGYGAFYENQLTSVTIGNGITSIGDNAFSKSNGTVRSNGVTYYNNPNLSSITIDKSCSDIKNNLLGTTLFSDIVSNYYPWLSDTSPYTGIGGVTIYGSNNEVCDTF